MTAIRVGVVDYGVGNLRSVRRALEANGAEVDVTADRDRLASADGLVLPGVGAFAAARQKLQQSGLDGFITDLAGRGKALLGVCLGYQLLFERSYEDGEWPGLGLLPGPVRRLRPVVKVPHIGWNTVRQMREDQLFRDIPDQAYFYFVHSYYARPADPGLAAGEADYGGAFTCAVARDNIFATQFHPEKSAAAGLAIFENFLRWNP